MALGLATASSRGRCQCEEPPSLVSHQLTDAGELLSMNTGSPLLATVLMT